MTPHLRVPRPLSRDSSSLRDDRLFIVACDDTYAPKQYFGFYRLPRVQVHVVASSHGKSSARHVLDRVLEFQADAEDDDELWILLDTDHYTIDSHRPAFLQTLADARSRGVNVALSRPCFEFWLLLHHCRPDELTAIATAQDAEQRLRATLGRYNKTRLRSGDFPLQSVAQAIVAARGVDSATGGGDIPQSNTSRIYRFWESIVSKSLPAQLPPELLAFVAA